jgi:hypothetical protein
MCLKFWAGSSQGGHVLEPTSKSWPHAQKVEGMRKKNFKKREQSPIGQASTCGRLVVASRPAVEAWGRWPQVNSARASQRPMVACRPRVDAWPVRPCSFFLNFLNFFEISFWKFGRMGVHDPPTLGSVKCSIPHGDWRFHFFSNLIFPKFIVHLDLHI